MACDCEPVSMREIASRTGTPVQTVQAWHYKRDSYRDPKLPEPQWPGNGDGPRWCWVHQLAHLHPTANFDALVQEQIDAASARRPHTGVTLAAIAKALDVSYEEAAQAFHRLHLNGTADWFSLLLVFNPRVFNNGAGR